MRRYEMSDEEWGRISEYFPEKEAGSPGRPPKPARDIINGIVWIACVVTIKSNTNCYGFMRFLQ